MDPRRLIPVTLVTLALGIAVAPIVSAHGRGPSGSLASPAAPTAVAPLAGGPGAVAARPLAPDRLGGLPAAPRAIALGPAAFGDATAPASRYIPVRTLGTARNESSDPLRQRFTFPLYSLVDGSLVGTATDDIACSQSVPPPCAVIDAITTFRFTQGAFPLGTVVNHAQVSIAPDVQRPGFIVNGARSSQPTIQGGTGAYAGRSGIVVLSGANDIRGFPGQLTQDDLWLIELQ
jgi:hypothetical protein